MKKIVLLLSVVILIISCSQQKIKPFIPKSDTTKQLSLFKKGKGFYNDIIYRIIKDTFKLSGYEDGETAKIKWVKDTSYYIPYLDTLKDAKTGLPIKDSAGKERTYINYYLRPKSDILIDANQSVDSVMKKLR